jgi:hypothetical protein
MEKKSKGPVAPFFSPKGKNAASTPKQQAGVSNPTTTTTQDTIPAPATATATVSTNMASSSTSSSSSSSTASLAVSMNVASQGNPKEPRMTNQEAPAPPIAPPIAPLTVPPTSPTVEPRPKQPPPAEDYVPLQERKEESEPMDEFVTIQKENSTILIPIANQALYLNLDTNNHRWQDVQDAIRSETGVETRTFAIKSRPNSYIIRFVAPTTKAIQAVKNMPIPTRWGTKAQFQQAGPPRNKVAVFADRGATIDMLRRLLIKRGLTSCCITSLKPRTTRVTFFLADRDEEPLHQLLSESSATQDNFEFMFVPYTRRDDQGRRSDPPSPKKPKFCVCKNLEHDGVCIERCECGSVDHVVCRKKITACINCKQEGHLYNDLKCPINVKRLEEITAPRWPNARNEWAYSRDFPPPQDNQLEKINTRLELLQKAMETTIVAAVAKAMERQDTRIRALEAASETARSGNEDHHETSSVTNQEESSNRATAVYHPQEASNSKNHEHQPRTQHTSKNQASPTPRISCCTGQPVHFPIRRERPRRLL